MNKKTMKILSIILCISMLITVSTQVFAANGVSDPSNVSIDKNVNSTQLNTISGTILGLIRAIGIIISVGVLMVIGIKYMMGSAEEKAEYKKTMIPYIVGAVVLFTASALAQSIYNIFAGSNG